MSHFAIRGDSGFVKVGPGAQAGIISKWNISGSGSKPDGTPRLRFRAQFSWVNTALMELKLQKRIVVQMKTKNGVENVDILHWDEWRFEGGILTLENVLHVEGVVKR